MSCNEFEKIWNITFIWFDDGTIQEHTRQGGSIRSVGALWNLETMLSPFGLCYSCWWIDDAMKNTSLGKINYGGLRNMTAW